MGRTHTLPGVAAFHQAGVVVFHAAVLLDHIVPVRVEWVLEEGRLGPDHHVGIHGEGVGQLGIPGEGLAETLGDLERSGATVTEVLERFCFQAEWLFRVCQEGLGEGDGVVGRARIQESDGIHVGNGMGETAFNDAGLVLHHQEEDDTVVGMDEGHKRFGCGYRGRRHGWQIGFR